MSSEACGFFSTFTELPDIFKQNRTIVCQKGHKSELFVKKTTSGNAGDDCVSSLRQKKCIGYCRAQSAAVREPML